MNRKIIATDNVNAKFYLTKSVVKIENKPQTVYGLQHKYGFCDNISEERTLVENLIKLLEKNDVEHSQINYIIEDYVAQHYTVQ